MFIFYTGKIEYALSFFSVFPTCAEVGNCLHMIIVIYLYTG